MRVWMWHCVLVNKQIPSQSIRWAVILRIDLVPTKFTKEIAL